MNNEIPLNLLIDKIQNKQAVFVVVGLGRVGLPLSSVLANSGFNVIGIDVDENKLESIRNSKCPFFDPPLQESLEKSIGSGRLTVSKTLQEKVDVIFLTVGTPSSTEGSVDYSQLYTAIDEICSINLLQKLIVKIERLTKRFGHGLIIFCSLN